MKFPPISVRFLEIFWNFHRYRWNFLKFFEISTDIGEISWNFWNFHWYRWDFLKFWNSHRYRWELLKFFEIFTDIGEKFWFLLKSHRIKWDILKFFQKNVKKSNLNWWNFMYFTEWNLGYTSGAYKDIEYFWQKPAAFVNPIMF